MAQAIPEAKTEIAQNAGQTEMPNGQTAIKIAQTENDSAKNATAEEDFGSPSEANVVESKEAVRINTEGIEGFANGIHETNLAHTVEQNHLNGDVVPVGPDISMEGLNGDVIQFGDRSEIFGRKEAQDVMHNPTSGKAAKKLSMLRKILLGGRREEGKKAA